MFKNASTFPTSTLKCLLENTELADLLFKNFPLAEDDHPRTTRSFLSSAHCFCSPSEIGQTLAVRRNRLEGRLELVGISWSESLG